VFVALGGLAATRASSQELYRLAQQELESCGTFFGQQGLHLATGDALFEHGRCIEWWIAAEGRLVRVPSLPVQPVQAALAQGPASAIYLSGGRAFFGDPRYTSVDARPKSAVYRWSPGASTWSDAPPLTIARAKHASVSLSDGRVAVIGGEGIPLAGNSFPSLSSVEFLSPSRDGSDGKRPGALSMAWQPGPPLEEARSRPAALVTRSDDIVVIGGENRRAGIASVEMLASGSRSWQRLAPMREGRYGHTATLLKDGRILVTGGMNARDRALDRAEIWSPAPAPFGSWSSAGTIPGGPRAHHTATLLDDGRVVVIGGVTGDGIPATPTTAVWSPGDDTWRSDAALPEAPYFHSAFVQPDHSILVISSSPFRKAYDTDSTLAYRFRLEEDLSPVDVLTQRAIARGSSFLATGERDSLPAPVRDGVVARLMTYAKSPNDATCNAAWDALVAIGGGAYSGVVEQAGESLNSPLCRGSVHRSPLAILADASEPLPARVADQVADYFEASGNLIALREWARKRTFSDAAIARWLAPEHRRLVLAFEWLIGRDVLRFDETLAKLDGLVQVRTDELARTDPAGRAVLSPLLEGLRAKATASPMRELAQDDDGLPRDVQLRRAALDALALGLIANAFPPDATSANEEALAARLSQFVKRETNYLSDPVELGTLIPGAGASTFTIFGLGGTPRASSYIALRIVRPAVNQPARPPLAWDIVGGEETFEPDDLATVYDAATRCRNVIVRTPTATCAEGRTILRYDPVRDEFGTPAFDCVRPAP
jgi:hypothetical protein